MARIAVQLAVPVALGLVIGGVLAFQAGSSNSGLYQVALGTPVTPTPTASVPAPGTATPATTRTANAACVLVRPAHPRPRPGRPPPTAIWSFRPIRCPPRAWPLRPSSPAPTGRPPPRRGAG